MRIVDENGNEYEVPDVVAPAQGQNSNNQNWWSPGNDAGNYQQGIIDSSKPLLNIPGGDQPLWQTVLPALQDTFGQFSQAQSASNPFGYRGGNPDSGGGDYQGPMPVQSGGAGGEGGDGVNGPDPNAVSTPNPNMASHGHDELNTEGAGQETDAAAKMRILGYDPNNLASVQAFIQAQIAAGAAKLYGSGGGGSTSAYQQELLKQNEEKIQLQREAQAQADAARKQGMLNSQDSEYNNWRNSVVNLAASHPYGAQFAKNFYLPGNGQQDLMSAPASANLLGHFARNPGDTPIGLQGQVAGTGNMPGSPDPYQQYQPIGMLKGGPNPFQMGAQSINGTVGGRLNNDTSNGAPFQLQYGNELNGGTTANRELVVPNQQYLRSIGQQGLNDVKDYANSVQNFDYQKLLDAMNQENDRGEVKAPTNYTNNPQA